MAELVTTPGCSFGKDGVAVTHHWAVPFKYVGEYLLTSAVFVYQQLSSLKAHVSPRRTKRMPARSTPTLRRLVSGAN